MGRENKHPIPRLGRRQVIKLSRLLNMRYRPSEIAELIGVTAETVRTSYMAAGCPFQRDKNGHIWIVGTEFRHWAEDVIAKKKRKDTIPMEADEAWCFRCRDRVKLIDPQPLKVNLFIELLQSKCPQCGTKINRARASAKGDQEK